MNKIWTMILASYNDDDRKDCLKAVLRTRRKYIYFSLNGKSEAIPRAKVRDWLRDSLGVK